MDVCCQQAIDPPQRKINAPKRRFSTGNFLGLKSLDLTLFDISRTPRPLTDLGITIGIISVIEKGVVIVLL